MKECKYCGMPIEGNAEDDLCDFCRNDDGIEMIATDENEDDIDM